MKTKSVANAEQAELLQQYQMDLSTDLSATQEQRDKSNEELRFAMVPGGQWEGWLDTAYINRAKIELDQVSDYLYRTYSSWTENRMAVNYSPDDDASSDKDAELLDGLLRRDMRRGNGQMSIDRAVFEAMACGYGAVVLNTEYEDEEDAENKDQCVRFEETPNAYSMVVFDSGARRVDKSDAMHCTVLIAFTPDQFKKKYPDADLAGLMPQDRRWFNWTTPQIIYVAKRYTVKIESTTIYVWGNPETGEQVRLTKKELETDRVELEAQGFQQISEKPIRRRNVYVTKFIGSQLLEKERRIAGKYIPVIPFYGYYSHVDGVDYWMGVVRKRMDGQRLLNMSASLMAESAANGSEDKLIFAPEQMQSVKQHWAGNTHQKPYLLAEPIRDQDGTIKHLGPVGTKPGATQAIAAQTLMTTVREIIQQGTGGAPQDTMDTDASGKAINAILRRVDQNAQPIFDNIKASLKHMGEVYRWIGAEIYGERSRMIKIVTREGETQRRKLLEMQGADGELVFANDPSKGRFEVIVDTGPSFQTQREETIISLKDIAQTLPDGDPLQRLLVSRIIEMLPSQGMDDIKQYVRRQLLAAGIRKPETDEDKAFVQQLAQRSGQQNPQDALILAATDNQAAEAEKNRAEAEESRADAFAKKAKGAKDLASIGIDVATLRQTQQQPAPVTVQ